MTFLYNLTKRQNHILSRNLRHHKMLETLLDLDNQKMASSTIINFLYAPTSPHQRSSSSSSFLSSTRRIGSVRQCNQLCSKIERRRAGGATCWFKFGKNGVDAEGAGIYGSQSRNDFDRDDVEQVGVLSEASCFVGFCFSFKMKCDLILLNLNKIVLYCFRLSKIKRLEFRAF